MSSRSGGRNEKNNKNDDGAAAQTQLAVTEENDGSPQLEEPEAPPSSSLCGRDEVVTLDDSAAAETCRVDSSLAARQQHQQQQQLETSNYDDRSEEENPIVEKEGGEEKDFPVDSAVAASGHNATDPGTTAATATDAITGLTPPSSGGDGFTSASVTGGQQEPRGDSAASKTTQPHPGAVRSETTAVVRPGRHAHPAPVTCAAGAPAMSLSQHSPDMFAYGNDEIGYFYIPSSSSSSAFFLVAIILLPVRVSSVVVARRH